LSTTDNRQLSVNSIVYSIAANMIQAIYSIQLQMRIPNTVTKCKQTFS